MSPTPSFPSYLPLLWVKLPFLRIYSIAGLPLSQADLAGPIQTFWTYRLYFQTIQEVLAKNSYQPLIEAAGRQLAWPLLSRDIQGILIYSEKHGNWYHPAKIEVITPQGCALFVLNAALTERGRDGYVSGDQGLKVFG